MATALAEGVSHFCVWTLGLVAFIHLLQQFEHELKPLVLSFIFVSILEGVVQFFEWVFQKTWRLLKLLVWKLWQLTGMLCVKFFGCGAGRRDVEQLGTDILHNWRDLFRRWQGSDAGRYSVFRMIAVGFTLVLVGLATLGAKTLVQGEVAVVMSKVSLYKAQITSMVQYLSGIIQETLPHVPDHVPPNFQNQTRAAIKRAEANLAKLTHELPAEAETYGLRFLNEIVSLTTSSFMSLVFFMLYSAFLLFDPLHINFEANAEHLPTEARKRPIVDGWFFAASKTFYKRVTSEGARGGGRNPLAEAAAAAAGEGRSGPLSRQLLGEDATPGGSDEDIPTADGDTNGKFRLNEVQHYVYKIVWQYFLFTVLLNLIFAAAVYLLLSSLGIDLAAVLAACTFLLSFIPELGAIMATVLPVPFIMLTPTEECHVPPLNRTHSSSYVDGIDVDCVVDLGERLQRVAFAMVGYLVIKLLVSNILSAYLMGRSRTLAGALSETEEVRETHGVLVLFAVVFFGKIWGIVGMLISVPVLSVVRLTFNMGLERAGTTTAIRKMSLRAVGQPSSGQP